MAQFSSPAGLMAVRFRQHPSQGANDEVHLLQSKRFLRGTAPLVSTINERQIANALTDVVYYPGSRVLGSRSSELWA